MLCLPDKRPPERFGPGADRFCGVFPIGRGRVAMPLTAGGIFLALSLMAEAVSVPGKENLVGGPESPASKEPPNPEGTAGIPRPGLGDALGWLNHGDAYNAPKGFEDAEARPLGSGPPRRFLPWPRGVPEEPVCQVKLEQRETQAGRLLEVVGLLNNHDRGFLAALSGSSWAGEELETFGWCPTEPPHGLLSSLRRAVDSLAELGSHRLLLLHLEEVKWEPGVTKLSFQFPSQEETDNPFPSFQLGFLVFYRGDETWEAVPPWKRFLVGGEGLFQKQVICLSQRTRYLVLQASEILADATPGRINMAFSLEVKLPGSKGVTLSPREAQDLLFGFDAKCFTRRTPTVFLMAQQNPIDAALPPPSYLAAGGRVDMVPYLKASELLAFREGEVPSISSVPERRVNISAPLPMTTGRFLETLARFVNHLLTPSGGPHLASRPHLQLDLGTMEALPHSQLNLSEKGALEQLVGLDDHLVVLFAGGNQAWVDQQAARWSLEGPLLQQLLQKLRTVIQDLGAMPSFQSNAEHLQTLLAFCYYPPGGPEKPSDPPGTPSDHPGDLSVGDHRGAEGSGAREKFHSLLLLKALQAVRARWWQTRQASSRAHRRARHQDDYCQLRELKIDLVYMRHIILPNSYNANNCAGPCRSPLSTRIPDFYSHTVFLLRMHEQGTPLARPPCCIPVKYSKFHMITVTEDQGMEVKAYPNMVAESCGCR